MQDTKNLKRKVDEYSKKIRELQQSGAALTKINYWRRELNRVHERIRTRDENRQKNTKQHKKAN